MRPPVVDGNPAPLISLTDCFEKSHVNDKIDRRRDFPTGEPVVASANDSIDYFAIDHNTLKNVSSTDVDFPYISLAKMVFFDCPRKKPLIRGAQWIMPGTKGCGVSLPCEVVGFFQVGERRTAKVLGKKHLTNQEVRQCSDSHYAVIVVQETSSKKASEDTFIGQGSPAFQLISYLDLDTGIALRQECTLSDYRTVANPSGQTSVSITQVIDA